MSGQVQVSNIRTDGRNLRAAWLTTLVVVMFTAMFTAMFIIPAMAEIESEEEATGGQNRSILPRVIG